MVGITSGDEKVVETIDFKNMNKWKWMAIIGSLLYIIGLFLPWVSFNSFGSSFVFGVNMSGVHIGYMALTMYDGTFAALFWMNILLILLMAILGLTLFIFKKYTMASFCNSVGLAFVFFDTFVFIVGDFMTPWSIGVFVTLIGGIMAAEAPRRVKKEVYEQNKQLWEQYYANNPNVQNPQAPHEGENICPNCGLVMRPGHSCSQIDKTPNTSNEQQSQSAFQEPEESNTSTENEAEVHSSKSS